MARAAADLPNLTVVGYQPAERVPEVLATADVHLVLLKECEDLARELGNPAREHTWMLDRLREACMFADQQSCFQLQQGMRREYQVSRHLPIGVRGVSIVAAVAVDREFVYIFCDVFIRGGENGLTEGRERFKKVPGGRRIRSGRV